MMDICEIICDFLVERGYECDGVSSFRGACIQTYYFTVFFGHAEQGISITVDEQVRIMGGNLDKLFIDIEDPRMFDKVVDYLERAYADA